MAENRLEKASQSPLYQQLMQRLRSEIGAGEYAAGARIPSEQELTQRYGVSRVTVRKALSELTQDGLLVRRQGKGTFVAGKRLSRDLSSITSFSQACRQVGKTAHTRLLHVQSVALQDADAEKLGLPNGSTCIEVARVRLADDKPVMLETNLFPPQHAFLLEERPDGSLYELLRRHELEPSHAEHFISLGHATAQVSRYLGVQDGEAVLLLDEIVYDQRQNPLHLSRQWIRGDRFTFRI